MAAFGMGSASAYGNNPMGGLSRIQQSVRYTPPVQMPRFNPGAGTNYPMPVRPVPGSTGMDPGFGRPAPGSAAAGAADPVAGLLAQLGIRTPAQRALFSRWITAANQGR